MIVNNESFRTNKLWSVSYFHVNELWSKQGLYSKKVKKNSLFIVVYRILKQIWLRLVTFYPNKINTTVCVGFPDITKFRFYHMLLYKCVFVCWLNLKFG